MFKKVYLPTLTVHYFSVISAQAINSVLGRTENLAYSTKAWFSRETHTFSAGKTMQRNVLSIMEESEYAMIIV